MTKLALTILILFTLSLSANAAVQFPRRMTSEQRQEVLRILGLSSGGKILSDPYPLGGYSGVEFGPTIESISIEDLSKLGAANTGPQDAATFIGLMAGKGVYNDVDLFLHFVPYLQGTQISRYGAMVRWGFFQAQFLPLSLSINVNAEIANFSNVLSTRTVGADLVGGINVNNVALYAGAGPSTSTGTFIGGPDDNGTTTDPFQMSFTASNGEEKETVKALHTVIGVCVTFGSLNAVAELDRYTQPVYSGKIGFRF